MIPAVDNSHVAEAIAFLTDAFKKQANVVGLVTALADIQQIEDAAWLFLNSLPLGSASGDLLDKYGSILGVPRAGLSDGEYALALQVQIRILRSQGGAEDIIQIALLILTSPDYEEYPLGSWTLQAFNVAHANIILKQLGRAKAAGTRGAFLFSDDANQPMIWNSYGFSDLVSGTLRYPLVSSQEFK